MTPATEERQSGRVRAASLATAPLWWSLGLLTLLGLAVRLIGLGARSVWTDEVYSLYWASQPWLQIPALLLQHESHPPLFYLLLHLWAPLGGDDALLRLPSVVLGALAIPLSFALGRLAGGARVGLLAAGLVTISPLHLWYSQEARPYPLLTLLLGLATLALLRLCRRPSVWAAAGYALAAAAALYTHYAAAPILVGLTLGLLPAALRPAGCRWRRPWLAGTLLAGLLFAPWMAALLIRAWGTLATVYTVSYRAAPPDAEAVAKVLFDLGAFGLPYWRLPGARPEWVVAGIAALAVVGAWRLPGAGRSLLIGGVGGTLATGWLLAQRYPVFFQAKVFLPLVPLLAVLLAAGALRLWEWRRLAGGLAGAAVLAVALTGTGRIVAGAPVGWVEDWRAAAASVASAATADDVVLFVPAGRQLPFARAYAGRSPAPAMHGLPIDYTEARGFIEPAVGPADLPQLAARSAGRRQFWLVTVPDGAPQVNTALAVDFYSRRATLQQRIDLPGIILYRFTASPAPSARSGGAPGAPSRARSMPG